MYQKSTTAITETEKTILDAFDNYIYPDQVQPKIEELKLFLKNKMKDKKELKTKLENLIDEIEQIQNSTSIKYNTKDLKDALKQVEQTIELMQKKICKESERYIERIKKLEEKTHAHPSKFNINMASTLKQSKEENEEDQEEHELTPFLKKSR